jgi:malate synthase
MSTHFLNSYCELLVQTCHKRGVHAMGGMAAQIPIKDNPDANRAAMEKVIADKRREVKLGHDGTWVAHPGLVSIAREVFDVDMPTPNQVEIKRPEINITEADLLQIPTGTITEVGLRTNINVGLMYLESWLNGNGCVPLYNLMEDAATAEICRAQIWQWIKHPTGVLSDGRRVTKELVTTMLQEELKTISREPGKPAEQLQRAADLFLQVATNDTFPDFLTLPAYEFL